MCFKMACSACNRPTWAGCGAHIDSALAGIPLEDRCHCKKYTNQATRTSSSGAAATPNGRTDGAQAARRRGT